MNIEKNEIEPRIPDIEIKFETLDEDKINSEFEKIRSGKITWTLLGNNPVLLKQDIHSCTSLTAHLLKAGGIEEILKNATKQDIDSVEKYAVNKFTYDWVVSTPRNLEVIILLAQRIEQKTTASKKDTQNEKTTSNNDNQSLEFKLQ